MKAALFFGAFVALASTPSFAQQPSPIIQWETGERLYSDCTLPSHESFCFGYLEAIADALGGGQPIFGGYRACLPQGIIGYRLREIVLDYLEHIPAESRKLGAALLVTLALSDKFPCRHQ